MYRAQALFLAAVLSTLSAGAEFSGSAALSHTRRAVGFGPRPAGSAALSRLAAYVRTSLRDCRCEVSEDRFSANTPAGPVAMRNILARFPGSTGRAIVITGHYDTKRMPGFLGANDGGASTGFLLELARVLAGVPRKDDVILVWFDGEEAVEQWSESDGLYGSRHLASRWAESGALARIKALINVDMVGDRALDVIIESDSTPALRRLALDTARSLGYARQFSGAEMAIEDDHLPFLRRGVPSLDLIDFNYGPGNSYWHTPADTLDKLSAASLEAVGRVVAAMIPVLESTASR